MKTIKYVLLSVLFLSSIAFGGNEKFTAGESIKENRLVTLSSGKIYTADPGEDIYGIATKDVASGGTVDVTLISQGATQTVTASGQVAKYNPVYLTTAGRITAAQSGIYGSIGIAMDSTTSKNDKIRVYFISALNNTGSSIASAISSSNTKYVAPSSNATDASYFIQTQLNNIATTGGTVVIPDGIYYLGSTITIPGNNITIEMGRGTIIRPLSDHTFTKVDYRSNGTYNMVPMFYATGRSNVHIIGGKIDWDWAETELTITAVSGSDVTVAENLTGKVAVNDYVYTLELADPSLGNSSKDGKVTKVVVNGTTGATTLTIATLATSLAANDRLMYGGPLTKSTYIEESWAPIWLDNCTDSTVEDTYIDAGGYYVDMATGRAYCVLFSRCTDCKGVNIKAYKGGYECLGVRDGNLRTGYKDCLAQDGRRHSGQIADWAPTITGTARNESCYFTGIECDDTLIIHGGAATAEKHHKITNCTTATIQITGNVWGALVANNQAAYINTLLLGDYGQQDNLIINNTLYRAEVTNPTTAIRIYASGNTTPQTMTNLTIANNVIRGGRIFIDGPATTGTNFNINSLNIIGNTVTNTLKNNHGVEINMANNSNCILKDVAIQNNHFTLHSQAGTGVVTAMLALPCKDSTINGLYVTGNVLTSSYYVFNTEGADSDFALTDFVFLGNHVKSTSNTFRFNGTPAVTGAYMMNNWIHTGGYIWSDTGGVVTNGWIDGNYFRNWNDVFPAGSGAPVMGYNNALPSAQGTSELFWRTRVDLADPDKSYIEQLVNGTWTIVGTTDRTP